ncbi:hypothetical protein VST7929_00159 [Vibrio stylophorae]|uniref:Type II secretion system protein I n=1 Tax=Vibrio stylophorae TaxID=659351 RepID=A0ABN8DMK6_9VIBR|nr:type II secretion system minor pseudopilin GspI [Vibrio stylophorae]CAH0532341.1 hypothetical protein VST7929_00159 [Vibrio stylophorae]
MRRSDLSYVSADLPRHAKHLNCHSFAVNRGFTLLEVMVALAIFALSSMALLQSMSQHSSTLIHLQQNLFANWVAENQQVKVALEGVPSSTKQGKSEMAGQTFYWKIQPQKTSEGSLVAVDVAVSTEANFASQLLQIRSYRAKP